MGGASGQLRGPALALKVVDVAAELFYANGIRARCVDHEEELRLRLRALVGRIGVADCDRVGDRLHIAVVGTVVLGGLCPRDGPATEPTAIAADLVPR